MFLTKLEHLGDSSKVLETPSSLTPKFLPDKFHNVDPPHFFN